MSLSPRAFSSWRCSVLPRCSRWALACPEQWIILGALVMVALVPIIVRWPVVTTFGLYALLACSFDVLPLLRARR